MKVFIRSGLDYGNVARAVSEGMDRFPLEYSGKTVLIKPNLLGPYPPENAATTHPAVVKAVLDHVKSRGARRVYVGDSPGMSGYGLTRKVGEVTGVADAAGNDFVLFSKDVKRAPVRSRFFGELSFPRLLDEVDLIVNVPKFKTHALTYVTGALKNMFGVVVGADKARVHSLCRTPVEFAEAMVDIFCAAPPALNVMDAVTGMEGNGPNVGTVVHPGCVLVSDNALAMDTVMATAMGFNPRKVPILRIAGQRGLGGDGKIETVGDELNLKKFRKPVTYYILNNPILQFGLAMAKFIFKRAASNHLTLDPANCTRCGVCMKQCPVGAITMGAGTDGAEVQYPSIDGGKCISCYCCYELCDHHAWKLPD